MPSADAAIRRRVLRSSSRAPVLLLALALASCASGGPTAPAPAAVFSFLAFGDHGYHLDYLEDEETTPPKTPAQFLAAEREEWREDKRPETEFMAAPMVRLPRTGGYVEASGMLPVARAMRRHCQSVPCQAALMLGDNVYPNGATLGRDGREDAQRFESIFRVPFQDLVAGDPAFRIYATLGNHDWKTSREGALAQMHYLASTPPFYMDGVAYRVVPPGGQGEVEIFVIDTHVLLAGDTVYEDQLDDDGREVTTDEVDRPDPWVVPQTEQERTMVPWLEQALQRSTARWKIVMGHHPLRSSAGSKFQQARTLRRLLLPTLCRGADLYFSGHEHTLELHRDDCRALASTTALPPLAQIVSGAAAKQRPLNTNFMRHQASSNPELSTLYARGMVWGFAHVTLYPDEAVVSLRATPVEDSQGQSEEVAVQRFARRSGLLRP
ncbi:MAG: hypothetical protein DI587_36185 [Variovorax paradoxus]|nr:MAG: hypothetical protein DI583_36185 [Variovorax paradoxus]PZQ00841.1 MAG: hypothetical protein DI587_36185 [Variovorax paradoxus]